MPLKLLALSDLPLRLRVGFCPRTAQPGLQPGRHAPQPGGNASKPGGYAPLSPAAFSLAAKSVHGFLFFGGRAVDFLSMCGFDEEIFLLI